MSSRTARKLVAEMGDGRTIEMVTSGDYELAGAVFVPAYKTREQRSYWSIVAKGSSSDSVRSRTITRYNRHPLATRWEVVRLREEIVWPVAEYLASRPLEDGNLPTVRVVFIPGKGWVGGFELLGYRALATRRVIKLLAGQGATSVSIGDESGSADFTVAELLKRRSARKV